LNIETGPKEMTKGNEREIVMGSPTMPPSIEGIRVSIVGIRV
jgi:hypothetical protein